MVIDMLNIDMSSKMAMALCAKKNLDIFLVDRGIDSPTYKIVDREARIYGGCGYYTKKKIVVSVKDCGHIGKGGPAWSFPGHLIDRTPYGVVAHECGHYVDDLFKISRTSEWKKSVSASKKITNYEPNLEESFAESFRVFFTNPSLLLAHAEPRFSEISKRVEPDAELMRLSPIDVLMIRGAPTRTIERVKFLLSQ